MEVHFLKIDAQGYDLSVVQSAGPMLSKIRFVTLEAVCDSAPVVYLNAPNCSTVWSFMTEAGFSCMWMNDVGSPEVQLECLESGPAICQACTGEMDLTFQQNRMS